jgi:beta-N-acetylhexosaminidase
MIRACILGCGGTALSADERALFVEAQPFGFILFARNIESPEQVRTLVRELRATVGRADAPVLIDQEGGRVQRLREPFWPDFPPAARFGEIYARDTDRALQAARLGARLIAAELTALGINVDCLPVVDLRFPEGHGVIGDRAYGSDPEMVAALGGAAAQGLIDGGVLPVLKHIPGHGRARADSHQELPVVDAVLSELDQTDFRPFARLSNLPLAMTAHVVYSAIDPRRAATVSPIVIRDVIRGRIGFDGLLMSDDLSMKALKGSLGRRTEEALAAGCDVALHCNGRLGEMREVAAASLVLGGEGARRAGAALRRLGTAGGTTGKALNVAEAKARFSAMIAA